jgi:hypothetical protein
MRRKQGDNPLVLPHTVDADPTRRRRKWVVPDTLSHCRRQRRDLAPFVSGLTHLRDKGARPGADVPPPLSILSAKAIFDRDDPLSLSGLKALTANLAGQEAQGEGMGCRHWAWRRLEKKRQERREEKLGRRDQR